MMGIFSNYLIVQKFGTLTDLFFYMFTTEQTIQTCFPTQLSLRQQIKNYGAAMLLYSGLFCSLQ